MTVLMSRWFRIVLGLVATFAIAACGMNQFTFLPNCLFPVQAGPNSVAKVRYKVTTTRLDQEGKIVEETKTFEKGLGDAFELETNKSIKLPLLVELLNGDGTVLATRSINDPELVGRSADYPIPSSKSFGGSRNKTVTYVSAQGNRYEDLWQLTAHGDFAHADLQSRKVHFVDVESAAFPCAVEVPRPSPWSDLSPAAAAPASPTANANPLANTTLRLTARVTSSLPPGNKVEITTTYKDGPKGLYALFRQAKSDLPEQEAYSYLYLDQLWKTAGGTVETYFQPGRLQDDGSNNPTRTAIGAGVAIGDDNFNDNTTAMFVNLPWPTQEQFALFKGSDVTGYLVRQYNLNGQAVMALISNQVTWAKAPEAIGELSFQGLTITSHQKDKDLVINDTVASREVAAFISRTMKEQTGQDRQIWPGQPITSFWGSYAGVKNNRWQFRFSNGTILPGSWAMVGDLSQSVHFSLLPASAYDEFGEVKGRLEWVFPFEGGAESLIVHSQEYYLVKKPTTSSGGGGGGGGGLVAPAPTFTSIVANSGPAGTAVTITGTDFRAGATVTIGGSAATGVTVVSDTTMTATVPSLSLGAKNVVVTNLDATSVTSVGAFTVTAGAAPTFTSVVANNGPAGTAVTITGTNFRAGATVTIGGTDAAGVVVNGTTMTATVPSLSLGAKNVVVTNLDATTVTSAGAFTVTAGAAPTITLIAPNVWPQVLGFPSAYTITGTNFREGVTVTVNAVPVAVTFVDANTITGIDPGGWGGAPPFAVDVVVTNLDGTSVTEVGGVTIAP